MSEIKASVGRFPSLTGTTTAAEDKLRELRKWERRRVEIAVDQFAKDDLDYALLRDMLFGGGK